MLKTILLLLRTFAAGVRSRRDLTRENLALRHQLHAALRRNPHPRLQNRDRVLWVWLDRLWPDSRRHLLFVKPETVLRWREMVHFNVTASPTAARIWRQVIEATPRRRRTSLFR